MIENSLHRQLNVTLGEDQYRVRQICADINLSLACRQTQKLLKTSARRRAEEKPNASSVALDDEYLTRVLPGA